MVPDRPRDKGRQKRPKVKGCYECSRRRIDCDREEPSCQKCRAKNIKCSGLGIRYRFNQGVASRGKLSGKMLPILHDEAQDSPLSKTKDVTSTTDKPEKADQQDNLLVSASQDAFSSSDIIGKSDASFIAVGLDHIDPSTRFFLQYFSDNIAQVTAVINLGFNGYRDLVLPQAETDPLVRKALVVVAEQHLFLQCGYPDLERSRSYESLIRDLIVRSNECPPHQDVSAMTALLLLHLREMISGSDGFKHIYGSLRSILNVTGHSLDNLSSPVGEFVKIQILRLCLFGETLLGEANGQEYLRARGRSCLDFLEFGLRFHPELQDLINQLFELLALACDIYIQRSKFNPPSADTVHLVERFKCALQEVDLYTDIIGRHLLTWAYFVVAAESSTQDHREFFLEKLTSLHRTTGCWNVLKAVDQIQEIWATQSSVRWTSLLGRPGQALIM
ncbi:hypothetical protein BGZ63DRAFT_414236 [Mariannaea sp. PMI_226]|nr:hypothetical protein BGZ63DRAFT_414236 [Mariannaea sp. PMI_226]